MSYNPPSIIKGSFSNNVNSFNYYGGGYADGRGPPYAVQNHPAGRRVQTEPKPENPTQSDATQSQPTGWHSQTDPTAPNSTQSSSLGMDGVSGASRFLPEGAIFGEPRGGTTSSAPEEAGVNRAPVREPPAWKLNYQIGNGSFGTVFLEKVQTRGMGSPELWAVKRLSRTVPNFPVKQYQNEVKNLQALSNHEWFVKFNSSYQDADYVYIAMEYIPIGDMSKTFVNGYRWNESDTKVVIEQLLHGLAVMHREGITHRDLKPENIFLCLPESGDRVLRVKIGDFGASKHIPHSSSTTYLKTTTGTENYMAPEMDDTAIPKTNRVDIWALGCILYRMFAGSPLFNTRFGLCKYVMVASSPPTAVKNAGFSVTCVDFFTDVLQPEPGNRPSAEDCLKKPWIVSKALGSEYSIGGDLYKRLSKIELEAPDIDSFSDKVDARVAHNTPARTLSTQTTPATDSTASTLKSAWTFDTSTLGSH